MLGLLPKSPSVVADLAIDRGIQNSYSAICI